MRALYTGLLAVLIVAAGDGATAPLDLPAWGAQPPFSFRYRGEESRTFLPRWERTQADRNGPKGAVRTITYSDATSGLAVTVELLRYDDSPAVDWVLAFENRGEVDTPLIEAIHPLDWALGPVEHAVVHHARGSTAKLEDFHPLDEAVPPAGTVRLESEHGLSSSGATLPFFNLETDHGGVIGAIGWTGGWAADFSRDGPALRLTAGMKRTHLRLHPGERIRSPRIVLLPWQGADWMEAQNGWRRLVEAHYAPQLGPRPLPGPVMFGSWGSEPVANKLELIHALVDRRMPFDTYAVDAGWYGQSFGETEELSDRGKFPWWRERGDWWTSPFYYPQGLAPLGSALRDAGLGFSLWLEPETAEPGTQMLRKHPEWYLHVPNAINEGAALLDLGNPVARTGITKLVSDLVDSAQLTWYRQDFNIPPEKYWARADAPDRVGMTEIRHIEGLYAFWDQLLADHPGLAIDNCASGGRRLDLEMMSRSFVVWRSDFGCANPIAEQVQTQALAPWVPLNMAIETLWTTEPWKSRGPFGSPSQVYAMRLGYSAGYGSNPGPHGIQNDAWFAFEKQALSEYRELQPYFYGDFYPLAPYSTASNAWTEWQWDRPDLDSGIVLLLRRPDSPTGAVTLALHHLDSAATYDVELRSGFESGSRRVMAGALLQALTVTVADHPGSLLIVYHKRLPPLRVASRVLHAEGDSPSTTLEVTNGSAHAALVVLEPGAAVGPEAQILRLPAGGRGLVKLQAPAAQTIAAATYSIGPEPSPLAGGADLYPAYRDGETEGIVPVDPALFEAVREHCATIFRDSRIAVTEPAMPQGSTIYTPSPYYRAAGVFGRDFLFQLEGGGRYSVSAAEVRWAVDLLALRQLQARHRVRNCTYPVGAVPDRVRPDGQLAWGPGPGDALGDHIASYHRPSLDEAFCFVTLAWHYGIKAQWDEEWRQWFKQTAPRLENAWNSVPRNPATGLVTQWTTPDHLGGGGVTETNGPCVMWGFHDSYGFPGDDLGTSVLACNAARALADMYRHAGLAAQSSRWAGAGATMAAAIQRQFRPAGYLPWGVGTGAPDMASPDITGYAVWSRILTAAQADAASDWFADCYRRDRTQGGAADLFNLTVGLRGSIRMARKADDVTPGSHVWPHVKAPYWENLTFGYNAYQDGGYWYYMSLGVATTLWRRHPVEAKEWVRNACQDLVAEGGNYPYERIDGTKPVNFRYNASAGAVLGMIRPATEYSLSAAAIAHESPAVP